MKRKPSTRYRTCLRRRKRLCWPLGRSTARPRPKNPENVLASCLAQMGRAVCPVAAQIDDRTNPRRRLALVSKLRKMQEKRAKHWTNQAEGEGFEPSDDLRRLRFSSSAKRE